MSPLIPALIGLVAGGAVAWLVTASAARRSQREEEARITSLQNTVSRLRYENNEAGAKETRFEMELQKHKDLAVLFPEFVKQILSARTPDELARYLSRSMMKLTGCTKVAIFLADIRGDRLGLVHETGLEGVLEKPLVVKVGEGHIGFSAETGMVFSRSDLEKESELTRKRLEKSAISGFVPDMAAPMTSQGILYGVICVADLPPEASLPRERIRAIAAVGAAALEGIRLLGRFESASDMDPDTGLPGQARLEPLLQQELERVRRFDSPVSIMELEIDRGGEQDRFRAREFMSIAANHLKSTMRNIDTGVRTSEDRIVLLLPGTSEEGAEKVAERLLGELPALANDDGEALGRVGVRYVVVKRGGQETPEGVMGELSSRKFAEPEAGGAAAAPGPVEQDL